MTPEPTLIPPIVWRLPSCSLCEDDVAYDGNTYWCEPCGATWDDANGSLSDPGEIDATPRCTSTLDAFVSKGWDLVRGRVYRCALADGHDGDPVVHRGPRTDPGAPPLTSDPDREPGLIWSWRDGDRGESRIGASA